MKIEFRIIYRRCLVLCACCILSCWALPNEAFAQAEITITPRLEANFPGESKAVATPGFSSLYGFVDGEISSHFSYSGSFHFLSPSPKDLYSYESPFTDGTWVDWAYFSYDNDFLGVDLGKVVLNMGGFEFEKNDVDCYEPLVSDYWNLLTIYQPGVTFRLTPWDAHSFEAQLTTSPMMEDLNTLGFAASVAWRGEFGNFSTYWAANVQEMTVDGSRSRFLYAGLGNMYSFEKVDLSLDMYYGPSKREFDKSAAELVLRAAYRQSEMFSCELMAACRQLDIPVFGMLAEYYPLGNDALRLHVAASDVYIDNSHNFMLSLGITANLHINIPKK